MILYQFFILPFVYFFDVCLYVFRAMSDDLFISLLLLSIFLNFLCWPVYKKANELIFRKKELEKKMLPKIKTIRKNFSGIEQRMLLRTYYRQNGYNPILFFLSSLTILIQIPFFIAANVVLSSDYYSLLSSSIIASDILTIWSIPFHILPILMFIVNIVSIEVYMKSFSWKEKLSQYAIALLFLVLLYNSPSFIVLYWVFNNIFALLKNIYFRYPHSFYRALWCIFLLISVLMLWLNELVLTFYLVLFLIISPIINMVIKKRLLNVSQNIGLLISSLLVLLAVVVIAQFFKEDFVSLVSIIIFFVLAFLIAFYLVRSQAKIVAEPSFICLTGLVLALLIGAVLPLDTISSDPEAFFLNNHIGFLLQYIFVPTFVLFCVIPFCYSLCIANKYRSFISYTLLLSLSVVLYNIFYPLPALHLTLSMTLMGVPEFSTSSYDSLINLAIIALLMILIAAALTKLQRYLKLFVGIMAISMLCLIGYYSYKIFNQINADDGISLNSPEINLSRDGKNVMLIMLDTGVGPVLPAIFEEHPYIAQGLEGFVRYSNTISFAIYSMYSQPSLYGGYEYTPDALQKLRAFMPDKHVEAVSVVPQIFNEAGYRVSLYDVDLIEGYGLNFLKEKGIAYSSLKDKKSITSSSKQELIGRNLFFFSLLKTLPLVMRNSFYQEQLDNRNISSFEESAEIHHNALKKLLTSTQFDAKGDTYTVISNLLTHEPILLTEEYELPAEGERVKETAPLPINDLLLTKLYHVNVLSLKRIVDYLNYLKANDVYNNTRIIIASDHGSLLSSYLSPEEEARTGFNGVTLPLSPILMVKDFSASGAVQEDRTFMTLADIPLLLLEGLVKNPVNPFTKKPLVTPDKSKGVWVISTPLYPWEYSQKRDFYRFIEMPPYKYRRELFKTLIKEQDE